MESEIERKKSKSRLHPCFIRSCTLHKIFSHFLIGCGSDFHLQSYKQKKGFIIAQSPMTNTVVDFVKMLYERECGVVVMLCGCEEGGVELCAQYWPATAATMQHGELLVSTVEVTERDGITQRLITITDSEVHCYNSNDSYNYLRSWDLL